MAVKSIPISLSQKMKRVFFGLSDHRKNTSGFRFMVTLMLDLHSKQICTNTTLQIELLVSRLLVEPRAEETRK